MRISALQRERPRHEPGPLFADLLSLPLRRVFLIRNVLNPPKPVAPKMWRIIGIIFGVLAFSFETDVLIRHVVRRKQDFNQPAYHIHGIIRHYPKQPPPRVIIVYEPRCKEQRKGGNHDLKNLVPVTTFVTVNVCRDITPMRRIFTNEDNEPQGHHPEPLDGNQLIEDHPHILP